MANAVATVSLTDERYSWVEGNKYALVANVAIGASPLTYKAGGITMSFLVPLVKASRAPIYVNVFGQNGYIYKFIPGTDASNGKLLIFVQDAVATNPLLEMADALAIPAAVSGDTIIAHALFNGQN